MQLQQRKNFFMVFAVFFIICMPFMILYSSGFTLNNNEISSSLTIKTDTVPRQADIIINDKKTAATPYEISTTDTGNLSLQIQKEGFVSESFVITKENNQNSFADLTNLWLLPKTTINSSVANSSSQTASTPNQITNKQIISENQAIVEYQTGSRLSLGIIDFGVAGQVGEIQPISSSTVVGGKSLVELELSTQTKIKLLGLEQQYQKIGNDLFFKDNVLLVRRSGYWLAKNLEKLNLKAQSVARINSSSIAVLDTDKNLWSYNFETEQTRFIDTGFGKMKTLTTPSTIWLWKNDTIYRLEPADILSENIIWNRYQYLQNQLVTEQNGQTFDVQNLYQGIIFQVGKYLMYVPDFKKNQWQIIASNAHSMSTVNESMFWLDADKNLWTQNFNNNLVRNLARDVELTDKINYSDGWKRIMLYYPNKVDSIWYNKDIVNSTIKKYSEQNWITNQNCYPKVVDRVQYCLQNQDLVVYKNNSLF
jgi:PEGA domain